LDRASFFFEYSVSALTDAPTGRLVRPMVLLMTYGFQRPLGLSPSVGVVPMMLAGTPKAFVPLRQRVIRRLFIIAGIALLAVSLAIGLIIF
jgi:hypothetical protein